jgi:hypothetical protein
MTRDLDLTGQWAICNNGKVGRVRGRRHLEWGDSWILVGRDGQRWASRTLRPISEADVLLIEQGNTTTIKSLESR